MIVYFTIRFSGMQDATRYQRFPGGLGKTENLLYNTFLERRRWI
jgi:hypothetical protein